MGIPVSNIPLIMILQKEKERMTRVGEIFGTVIDTISLH